MIGLANMSQRGVMWKVNMAYDVLYNEVRPNDAEYYILCRNHNDFGVNLLLQAMVNLLMVKYDVDYATAIEYHLKEVIPGHVIKQLRINTCIVLLYAIFKFYKINYI